ncbi:Spo0E family sporulation regulatory protein-aspartic acid phosphatase [Virgibacillus byunsanensis]|uniref:Spo0E family sporulation regulatory protein-aspartic acid phosphatase n=1 Tax=Virgibacillus byunsanensis TaxID=570945 RepID=A0ABW3LN98_9BACI
MVLKRVDSLEIVSKDIYMLRNLMYKVKDRTGNMHDPLVIEISQFLDLKLNQHGELSDSYRWQNGGMYMTNSDKPNQQQSKKDEQEQIQWQKSVIREEHISSK